MYILNEEVSKFCSLYFEPTVQTRLNRVPRNDDGGPVDSQGSVSIFSQPERPLGPPFERRMLTEDEIVSAHRYILMKCEELNPIIVTKVDERITRIAYRPARRVKIYKGYFVNGFKFHTIEYGKYKATTNSGVSVLGSSSGADATDYYVMVDEIMELDYFGDNVVLFRCHWFDTNQRGTRLVHPRFKLVEINTKSRLDQMITLYWLNKLTKFMTQVTLNGSCVEIEGTGWQCVKLRLGEEPSKMLRKVPMTHSKNK